MPLGAESMPADVGIEKPTAPLLISESDADPALVRDGRCRNPWTNSSHAATRSLT